MSIWSVLRNLLSSKSVPERKVNLQRVQDIIGYTFKNLSLLNIALTHRSYINNNELLGQSNERMEFLGDSVLGLVIAELLFADHTDWREGDLTKVKALLVNETTLSEIGKEIGLNEQIYLSSEEKKAGGEDRASIVSDAFESVIAAVYLDGGIEAAKSMIQRLIYSRKYEICADSSQRNYKGELLELLQGRGEGIPRYDVVSEDGPDHEKVFKVIASVNGRSVGTGIGTSKKEAEQKAAAEALDRLT